MIRIKCKCGREMELFQAPEGGTVMCSGCLSEVPVPRRERVRTQAQAPPEEVWVTCRKCRNSFARPTRYKGRRMRCPICAKRIRVLRRNIRESRMGQPSPTSKVPKLIVVLLVFILGPGLGLSVILGLFVGGSDGGRGKPKKDRHSPSGYARPPKRVSPPPKPVVHWTPTKSHIMSEAIAILDLKIRNGRMGDVEWRRLGARIYTVRAKGEVVLDFPKDVTNRVLLVPYPADKWYSRRGNVSAFPGVDYRGQGAKIYRGIPFMALCWSRGEGSVKAVSRVPLVETRGPLVLSANDRDFDDNRGHIRVKVMVIDPAPNVPVREKTTSHRSGIPLVDRVSKGTISTSMWDDLEGTVVEVFADRETKTGIAVTEIRGILVVPHPKDTWHGKEGNRREYPWVGYSGQRNRLYRNFPFMSLLHRLETGTPGIVITSVRETPEVFGTGKLVLLPNDGVLTDNRGRIRVKLVPVSRDYTRR